MASRMSSLGGAPVVNIDTRVGGYDHDLTHSPVRVAILKLAQSPRCLGAFISLPCKTFSVLRGKPGVEFSKPLRSLEHVTGIPREDGSLPPNLGSCFQYDVRARCSSDDDDPQQGGGVCCC